MSLKLYHMWPSTCSKKVRICLAEKQLQWESHEINTNPTEQHLEDWYLALNPNGVVPTLDNDGDIVIESCVILEYLEDVFPEISLRPQNPLARARMRVWLDRSESVVHRHINVLSHNRFMKRFLDHLSLEEKLARAARQPRIATRTERSRRYRQGISKEEEQLALAVLGECLDDMESDLSRNAWLAGDEYSLADIAVAPFFQRFEVNELPQLLDRNKRPGVDEWWSRMQARPAYTEGMALERAN